VGRNDPCSCGSGIKHKRCCLEIEQAALRAAIAAEERISELGHRFREQDTLAWVSAYERNIAPLNHFGTVSAEFVSWLDLWLVCDEPVVDGRSLLEVAVTSKAAAADEWLRASSISGWWLRGTALPVPATPWHNDEPATLHCPRQPLGSLADGALLIGRGVEVGRGHVALIGRPVVVDEEAVDDLLGVLAHTPSRALFASLRWPEWREHTAEGELVQQCYRCYSLSDPEAAMAALRASSAATVRDVVCYGEDDVEFAIAAPSITDIVQPAAEPGVVWDLCEEDCADPPVLGEVTLSPADGELLVSAPTRKRADRLLDALPPEVRAGLGELMYDDLDGPDVLPRMTRDRLEELAPAW